MKAYFDQDEGNGYSLCRTHINSCDFALGNYAPGSGKRTEACVEDKFCQSPGRSPLVLPEIVQAARRLFP